MELKDISENDIANLADSSAILARGKNYYKSGQIKSMRISDGIIHGKVYGNYGTYDIEISIENNKISAYCDCPYDGYGCKHIVAILYKWINEKNNINTLKKSFDLEKEISKLDKDELVDIFLELCNKNDKARKEIMFRISTKNNDETTIQKVIKNQIKEVLSNQGFIDYYSVYGIVKELRKIRYSIDSTPTKTRTSLLKMLARKTYDAFKEGVDDSNGEMGGFIVDILTDLGKSISQEEPSQDEKKRLILEYLHELENEHYGLEDGYINILFEIATSKEDFDVMLEELQLIIKRKKKDYEKQMYIDIITEVHKRSGNDTEYLKILEKNAKDDRKYFPLVKYWENKGDTQKAISFAEEGIKTKSDYWHSNDELFEFLEEKYKEQNDSESLLRVLRVHFNDKQTLPRYKQIMKVAEKLSKWNIIKDDLLSVSNGKVRIEILLFEEQFEFAYDTLMANPGNLLDSFRDKVAEKLAGKYPYKALLIYENLVQEFINRANRDCYRIAAHYASKIRKIYFKLDQKKPWSNYIAELREKNKRKPALVDEFKRL